MVSEVVLLPAKEAGDIENLVAVKDEWTAITHAGFRPSSGEHDPM